MLLYIGHADFSQAQLEIWLHLWHTTLQSAVTVSQVRTWKRQCQKVEVGKQCVISHLGVHAAVFNGLHRYWGYNKQEQMSGVLPKHGQWQLGTNSESCSWVSFIYLEEIADQDLYVTLQWSDFHRHSWRHVCVTSWFVLCSTIYTPAVAVSQASKNFKRQWQKLETGKHHVNT